MEPLQPKRIVPDYGKSQDENRLHSKTRLPDYHDSAANVTNSAFYSNYVTASGPITMDRVYGGAKGTCPLNFWTGGDIIYFSPRTFCNKK